MAKRGGRGELGRLVKTVFKVECGPGNDEQAQGGADAPEQGGDCEGNLAKRVAPQEFEAVPKSCRMTAAICWGVCGRSAGAG